jgi:hypothetical protein
MRAIGMPTKSLHSMGHSELPISPQPGHLSLPALSLVGVQGSLNSVSVGELRRVPRHGVCLSDQRCLGDARSRDHPLERLGPHETR